MGIVVNLGCKVVVEVNPALDLTDGNGTTANGTSVDLGGSMPNLTSLNGEGTGLLSIFNLALLSLQSNGSATLGADGFISVSGASGLRGITIDDTNADLLSVFNGSGDELKYESNLNELSHVFYNLGGNGVKFNSPFDYANVDWNTDDDNLATIGQVKANTGSSLTDGNGTTANGTSVDLGGITTNPSTEIDSATGTENFSIGSNSPYASIGLSSPSQLRLGNDINGIFSEFISTLFGYSMIVDGGWGVTSNGVGELSLTKGLNSIKLEDSGDTTILGDNMFIGSAAKRTGYTEVNNDDGIFITNTGEGASGAGGFIESLCVVEPNNGGLSTNTLISKANDTNSMCFTATFAGDNTPGNYFGFDYLSSPGVISHQAAAGNPLSNEFGIISIVGDPTNPLTLRDHYARIGSTLNNNIIYGLDMKTDSIVFVDKRFGKGVNYSDRLVDESNVDWAADDDHIPSIGMIKANTSSGVVQREFNFVLPGAVNNIGVMKTHSQGFTSTGKSVGSGSYELVGIEFNAASCAAAAAGDLVIQIRMEAKNRATQHVVGGGTLVHSQIVLTTGIAQPVTNGCGDMFEFPAVGITSDMIYYVDVSAVGFWSASDLEITLLVNKI